MHTFINVILTAITFILCHMAYAADIPFSLSNSQTTYSHLFWPIQDDKSKWYIASGSPYHKGDDIFADDWNLKTGGDSDLGKVLVAAANGTVILADFAGNRGAYGKGVVIQLENNNFAIRYAHMDTVSVQEGQVVKVGDVLGTIGKTGGVTYAHLHFVLYRDINTSSALSRLKNDNSPSGLTGGASKHATYFKVDATVAGTPPTLTDGMTYISDTPVDYTLYDSEASFTKSWMVKNTGTTTWTSNYCLRSQSGTSLGTSNRVCVNGSVSPNNSYTFKVNMRVPAASTSEKTYRQDWELLNASNKQIGDNVYAIVKVRANSTIPNDPVLYGVDFHDDKTVDIESLTLEANRFIFIKASEGFSEGSYEGKDSAFESRIVQLINKGFIVGAYHFARPGYNPTLEGARKEARFFVNIIKPYYEKNKCLPPVIDIETNGNKNSTALTDWLLAFIDEVEMLLGIQPMLYMNTDYSNNKVDSRLKTYPLWIANYGSNDSVLNLSKKPTAGEWGTDYKFWQYTSQATVTGISGFADRNVFLGTEKELQELLVTTTPFFTWDIDGDGEVKALTDGLLVLRYLFGLRGESLIASALDDSSKKTAEDIETILKMGAESTILDIDNDGGNKPLTDGLLLLRYLFGFKGDALLNNAIDTKARRKTATEIDTYIKANLP